MKKILIVGGVAGGATVAARLRRLSEEDQIIMFERDEFISFANCGLPYYIGNVITDRDDLLVQTVEGMSQRFNLDIRNFSEVVDIDRTKKVVTVKKTQTGVTYEESYDVLILSPGAKPIQPPIEGLKEATNLFVLRNIPDTDRIYNYIAENKPKSAAVIGGGFIGVEMAENLRDRGIAVTLIEKLPQVMAPIDFEMAQLVHEELNANGVKLELGDGLSKFTQEGRKIHLESGKVVDADLVIFSIGVAPENTLAKAAKLGIGPRGHIMVNDRMETFEEDGKTVVKDVYALGDAVQVKDFITGHDTAIALAWPANRQARVLADYIHGDKDSKYNGSMGTSVLKVFNLTVSATGNNERSLKMKNIPYVAIHAHRGNHAGYYPGASNIALKLMYNPETLEILGAQAVGQEGTEKRIDVIATAIKGKLKVTDLSDLELAYAPPYSSAKDPVNVLGYIAENLVDGHYKMVHSSDIEEMTKNGMTFLDVRTPLEFGTGHVAGAINMEVDHLRDTIQNLKVAKDAPIAVICGVGLRAHVATMILRNLGYTNLHNMSGGMKTYNSRHYVMNSACPSEMHKIEHIEVTDSGDIVDPKHSGFDGNPVKVIDASGLQCPGPLLATYKAVGELKDGEKVQIISTDSGYAKDVESWCSTNGHTLVNLNREGGKIVADIVKGQRAKVDGSTVNQENATIVLFSGELDKALASMIIAQGAVAQGKTVTIFFTFWGLNALRRANHVPVKKTLVEKMFGMMMPRGSTKLPLSNMNMLGAGKAMIEGVMKQKNVDSLPLMMKSAQEMGVKFIACNMSMDLMGIQEAELIDGVELGGVATYISANENVGTTLFI